jgi:DNA-binding transcriptional MocR family regulator
MAATPLYQELADRIGDLIRGGTFPPGSRLPSVRRTGREQRVSITTALEAYALLEDRGLVEARPRSGYFVRPPQVTNGELPRPARAIKRPVLVRSPEILQAVMEAASDPAMVPFGAAVPGPDAIPGKQLHAITHAMIRRHGAGVYQYSMSPGRHELRAAVSRRLLAAGVKASPEEIVVSQGASEALALALRVTARRGDIIAVESPTYFGILHLARDLGLEVLEVPMDMRDGMDLDVLEALTAKHRIAACVVQPVFQNPVGSCMPNASKLRLAEMARRRDFAIIEDDLYGELSHSGSRSMAVAHFDADGRVLLCGSVSKSIAPGLRIGWIRAGRYHDEVKKLKSTHSLANSTLNELVVAEFLKSGAAERQYRRVSRLFAEQSLRMREAILREFPPGTRVNQPQGGFVLWVELPDGSDSETLASLALERGIGLIPGTVFSASCRLKRCLRLSCGAKWDERAAKAIRILGQLAAKCREDG